MIKLFQNRQLPSNSSDFILIPLKKLLEQIYIYITNSRLIVAFILYKFLYHITAHCAKNKVAVKTCN